jgi:hypothetical protein
MGAHAGGFWGAPTVRRASVGHAALPPTPTRRHDPLLGHTIETSDLRAALSDAPTGPSESEIADRRAALLEEARTVLAESPQAELILKQRLIDAFAAKYQPVRGPLNAFPPPPVKPAVWLLDLRFQLLEEPDPAARLLLLATATREMSGQFISVHDQRSAQVAVEQDRSASVALIGELLGLQGLPPNSALDVTFFEPITEGGR